MAERDITDRILRLIHTRGGWAFKTHGTGATRAGIPDIVGAHTGRALALEVKQPGRQATRIQQHQLDRAAAAGAIAAVVTTTHEVAQLLDQAEREAA